MQAPANARSYSATGTGGDPVIGQRRRVVVAMSGGVDSSVAAALMARAGHEVIGITLQLYDHGVATGVKGSCCAGQDIHDARRVAAHLGIAHYVLDYESRFRASVIDKFADAYLAGETPIPCVMCNATVKFSDLLATALDLGADALATGHYVERRDGPGGPALHRGADPARDQSYFLFATTRQQLERLWFPLGTMTKPEVRAIAAEVGLDIAAKPDSQDICFVPNGRYASVIEKLRPGAIEPGDVVDLAGNKLGTHDGIVNFTVGQRKGLGVATGEPLYVIRVDAVRREVVVGPREALATRTLRLRDFNWLGEGTATALQGRPMDVHARVRSSSEPLPATVTADDQGVVTVSFASGLLGAASGQACVLYDSAAPGARLLGGGYIAGSGAPVHKSGDLVDARLAGTAIATK